MKHFAIPTASALLVLCACNRTEQAETNIDSVNNAFASNSLTSSERVTGILIITFIKEALESDNTEIALGELAQSAGASQKVKDFGAMLAKDHGAHKQKLIAAGGNNIPATDEPSAKGKADLEELKTLRGADFDKQFQKVIIDEHTREIAKYEESAKSNDAQTAALAQETLVMLRKHLEAAKALL